MFKYTDEFLGREIEKLLFEKGYVTLKEVEDILNKTKETKWDIFI